MRCEREREGFLLYLNTCKFACTSNRKKARRIDASVCNYSAVLVSHPDMDHLGGLPYAVGKLGLKAPIYITGAGHKMGQMFMYDAYLTHHASSEETAFDLDDVDAAFGNMVQLRYRQDVVLRGESRGNSGEISITPYPAGHMIGGAIWKIQVGGNEVVYAVDYNHRREVHLNGTLLESWFSRPALLITDACGMGRAPVHAEVNEKLLIETCLGCLRSEGSVLIPIDAAGRVLEILLILNKYWNEKRLPYPLAVVGPMVHTTLDFARSQLEWMNESLVKSLGHTKDNPLALRGVSLCASMAEVKKLPRDPKVVLATSCSMNDGPSRILCTWWASQPNSAIILALQPEKNSLADQILLADADRRAAPPGAPPPTICIPMSKRVQLKGDELKQYEEEQLQKQQADAVSQASSMSVQDVVVDETEDKKNNRTPQQARRRSSVTVIGHAARDEVGLSEAHKDLPTSAGKDDLKLDNMDLDDGSGWDNYLLEGFETPIEAAAPLFPDEDDWENIQYDDYGAVVDVDKLDADNGIAGGSLSQALASEAAAERYGNEGGDEGMDVVKPEVPTKIETKEVTIQLVAQIVRIDFDGKADGNSVQTMLSHVAPRSAILVHGSPEATEKLASVLVNELEGLHSNIVVPNLMEPVEIKVGSSLKVILSDNLVKSVAMHPIMDYELGWMDARTRVVTERKMDDQVGEAEIVLEKQQAKEENNAYGGIFIGDVKLSQLKRALGAANIGSRFAGGGLYCDGQVLVKRGEAGGLVIEGSLGDEYYKIRDIVYSQYHLC